MLYGIRGGSEEGNDSRIIPTHKKLKSTKIGTSHGICETNLICAHTRRNCSIRVTQESVVKKRRYKQKNTVKE
ncbi:hypothetical protein POVCU2_0003920 [Plasmodium ovale curtisi]|uniref:Uncharacterized protein n=1 Tax=Plasmodium ovale curtisi TaxID=864141 RepID=A0A1A8X5Y8_PLAOA|nr:hypothetical protein POVCU2_0003920 [Plasmodium ovale curtisi]SBT00028.1 hypothetical protein POVCU1_056930 [Plasmodium ovale curtisi]